MKISRILLYASILLYGISCFLPCFYVNGIKYEGYFVLLLGWAGIFFNDDWHYIAWYANLFYWAAMFFHRYKVSAVFALPAFLLSLTFINCPYYTIDEAGHTAPIERMGIGYALWIASMAFLLVNTLIPLLNMARDGDEMFKI